MMRMVFAEVSPIAALLSDVVGGHGHKTKTRRGVELKLTIDESLTGLGEASPIVGFSADRLEDVTETLEGLSSFEVTLPDRKEQCRDLIAEQSCRLSPDEPSSRFALEGALLDLFARHLDVSAATLLAAMTTEPSVVADRVSLTRVISATDPVTCLTTARNAWARGYRVFKIKLDPSEAFDQTFACLRALREKYGAELSLRLDPNGSFPAENLQVLLEALRPFEPELVEEPAPWKVLQTLRESPVPLALDESLIEPDALTSLVERREPLRLCAVVVKPALLGLLRALELTEQARRLGLDVIVTHLFDGPVGHATALSLAQAVGSPHRAQGLAPHPGLLMVPNRRIAGLGHGQAWHEDSPGLPLLEVKAC